MRILSGVGIVGAIVLLVLALQAAMQRNDGEREALSAIAANLRPSNVVRLVAVGDVNLGRWVGQQILKGDTLYPFSAVKDSFAAYDIVFANLESQISEQNGRTEHPRNNLIFTGPPAGAWSLRKGGVTAVSIANNHALDFGLNALEETRLLLGDAGIAYAGASLDSSELYKPVILKKNGLRIALFACTDVMNSTDSRWRQYVTAADSGRLLSSIREVRDSVDFILVSFHGGDEYANRPSRRTIMFARWMIDGGADMFLGHHPHVPYGVERYRGKYIVHSLGNFVFRQPERFWTQRSFGFAALLQKDSTGTHVTSTRCIPVMAGFQPVFTTDRKEIDTIQERVTSLSPTEAIVSREK
jgi:poly-gamma-glutamate capsule biosynthesis protein CapA/YwtB (metallophosphatase superfamily)